MNRRGFMAAILAGCAAPAIVKAGSLMRVNPAIVGAQGGMGIIHLPVDFYTTSLQLNENWMDALANSITTFERNRDSMKAHGYW